MKDNIKKYMPAGTKTLVKDFVFIDGLTRTGKSAFSGILPSLKYFEHIKFYYPIEQIVPAAALGMLNIKYAKVFLHLNMSELIYDVLLSRNVNFRKNDQTGIYNYRKPSIYKARLKKAEGDNVILELKNKKRFFPFQTHDLLVNLKTLNNLDVDYKMIELFRNPIDTCYSWWKRGWGKRFGNDPRAFTLCINFRRKLLPWYCAGYEKEWLGMNEAEKCVKCSIELVKKSVKEYNAAGIRDRKKIHLLKFEDFARDTYHELDKICKFIGTEYTENTRSFVKKARCPREINVSDREKKLGEIKKYLRKSILADLLDMSSEYERNFYDLKRAVK